MNTLRFLVCIGFLWGLDLFAHGKAPTKTPPLYIGYDVHVTRKNKHEHRDVTLQFFITADQYIGYRFEERIIGSTLPKTRFTRFSNEYRRKITPVEEKDLVRQLIGAGIFNLKNETPSFTRDYWNRLDVRINGREKTYDFYGPPTGRRKKIHDLLLNFALKVKVDRPLKGKAAITVTEGDLQPAQAVTIPQLLMNLDRYHGKRVSITGYFRGRFESMGLYAAKPGTPSFNPRHGIWRGDISPFAPKGNIQDKNDGWLRVEGIFLKGPTGHFGMWPGEIVRLTQIKPM